MKTNDTPVVDLRKCVKGQQLLSKHGLILVYDGPTELGSHYQHYIKYPDGSGGTRTDDGRVFRTNRMDADHDIIYIFPVEEKVNKKMNKATKELLADCFSAITTLQFQMKNNIPWDSEYSQFKKADEIRIKIKKLFWE